MLILECKSIMWVDGIPISNFMCSEGRRKSREASPAVSTRSRDEEIPLGSMNKGSSSRKSSQSSSSSSTALQQQSSENINGPSAAVANSSSSTSNTTNFPSSSIQSTSHQTPSKLTLNLKSSSSDDPHNTQQSNSITTQVVTSNKDEEVTTPHLETSFISDVASDSGNASGNSVKSEEISSLDSVVPPPSPFQSSSHSSTNNGLANSVFVPKGKKKGVIETV